MPRPRYYTPLRIAAFVLLLAATLTVALIPIDSAQQLPTLGATAAEPVLADRDLNFESALLTEQARDAAAQATPSSLTLNTSVLAVQGRSLSRYMARVDDVRTVPDLSDEERTEALAAIPERLAGLPDAYVDQRTQNLILDFSDRQWGAVETRASALLSEILDAGIIEGRVDEVRAGVPDRVNGGLSRAQAEVVTTLVAPLVQPNVTEDPVATQTAREAARDGVAPVITEIPEGGVVVAAGQVVDALTAEALAHVEPEGGGVPVDDLVAMLILSLAGAATLGAYLLIASPDAAASNRRLVLVGALTLGAVAAARLYTPVVLPDEQAKMLELALPIAVAAILVSALLERTLALVMALVVATLAGAAALVHPDFLPGEAPLGAQALRPMVVFLFASVTGVFAAHRVERVTQYGAAGAAVGATVFVVGLAFWLLDPARDAEQIAWLALVALIVAVLSGVLTIGAFAFLGLAFGITTRLQLLELAQLTQPLLRRLQEEAPGTFHHSLLVATMAERAAVQIEADALLVRVGAYYHDIGKLAKPHMYIENQADGENPHDSLDPLESARVIQDHVHWGKELARQQRLPEQVRAFIPEHHGTRTVTYFYRKAARTDPEIDPGLFKYEGPSPRSRETALVMMADSCEAVVRSSRERDLEIIDRLVDGVINERLAERQFDDCDLTFRQLRAVAESFKVTLRGVYHPRIEYPAPTASERRRTPADALSRLEAAPAPTGDAPVDGSAPPAIAPPAAPRPAAARPASPEGDADDPGAR